MIALKQAVLALAGQSIKAIEHVFEDYANTPELIEALLPLIKVVDSQKGATWLLKASLHAGNTLTDQQTTRLLEMWTDLSHWESILHVLQCLSCLSIPPSHQELVERFVRHALESNNKFVRAWAYHGFYVLAKQYPSYQTEANQLFEMALRDESSAIKARVRQDVKAGF